MDLLIGAGRLACELIAGDINDLKALFMILFVHRLDVFILRREAAAGRSVDHHDDLALEISHGMLVSLGIHYRIIIKTAHLFFLRSLCIYKFRLPVQHDGADIIYLYDQIIFDKI